MGPHGGRRVRYLLATLLLSSTLAATAAAQAPDASGAAEESLYILPSSLPVAATLATGPFLFALAAWSWPSLRELSYRVPGLVTLTGLTEARVLDHPRRRKILETVRDDPGIGINELRRRLHLGNGNASHHIGLLLRSKLLVEVKGEGRSALFPAGYADLERLERLAAVSSPAVRRVLDAITTEPGSTQSQIAARTRLSPATVHYHARNLEAQALISCERAQGVVRYQPQSADEDSSGPPRPMA